MKSPNTESDMNFIFTIPKNAVKKRSDVCIVCCYDPKTREKRKCACQGSIINKGRHQYIYYDY